MTNARKKGLAGEIEACHWLAMHVFSNRRILTPNVDQSFSGKGWDIDAHPFAVEVKRREKLEPIQWWSQVIKAVGDRPLIPVVMYRQNYNQMWQFLISSNNIGVNDNHIHIGPRVFLDWTKQYVKLDKPWLGVV